jgi:hypothetical protein
VNANFSREHQAADVGGGRMMERSEAVMVAISVGTLALLLALSLVLFWKY